MDASMMKKRQFLTFEVFSQGEHAKMHINLCLSSNSRRDFEETDPNILSVLPSKKT
jgi:hypothetical protein